MLRCRTVILGERGISRLIHNGIRCDEPNTFHVTTCVVLKAIKYVLNFKWTCHAVINYRRFWGVLAYMEMLMDAGESESPSITLNSSKEDSSSLSVSVKSKSYDLNSHEMFPLLRSEKSRNYAPWPTNLPR